MRPSDQWFSTLNNSDENRYQGDKEKQVNESADGIPSDESQRPKNKQHHKNRPQHNVLLSGDEI